MTVRKTSDLEQAIAARDVRRVAKLGFAEFVRLAFPHVEPGTIYRHNWHVDAICEYLTLVTKGQIRKLAIHQPPGTMKSLLVSILWPIWVWIDNPGQRFFSVSYLPDLALDHTRRARDLMLTQWFLDRWGSRFNIPSGAAAGEYENDHFGWRYSASVAGGITGWHCDKMILDDLINPKELTPAGLRVADHFLHTVMPTRFRDLQTSSIVLVMQRLHQLDPGQFAKDEGFEILSLPMRFEPQAAWIRDPRKEPGELLCPDRFPEAEVSSLEKTLGSINSAAQLQQRPVPAGGAIFKDPWFRTWVKKGEAPPGFEAWTALPDRFDRIVQSWDCTFKGADDSDYVCGQVWGVKGPDFFLLDQTHARLNVLGTAAAIEAMAREWPKATAVLIEDKANGPAVIDLLAKRVRGMIAVNPQGGKESRANAVAVFFESGNVYHPQVEWIAKHRAEFTAFPMGAHDDQVDACTQALTWLHENRGNLSSAMANFAKDPHGWGI